MHRLARIVPVVVGLFVLLVVALLLTAKSRTAVESTATAAMASTADLRIKEVEIEEQTGTVRWRLKAEQALVYERERRTSLRKISVIVHDRDRMWTIVADEGDVHERGPERPAAGPERRAREGASAAVERASRVRDVEVRHNVVVTSSDGYRLETNQLHWDGAGRRLWTDAPVRLTREGTDIQGVTFELLTGEERATIRRVRAMFTGTDR